MNHDRPPRPARTAGRLLACWVAALACHGVPSLAAEPTTTDVPGREKTADTRALEVAAKLLQRRSPVSEMNMVLNGFHPMKDRPSHQMEAHHFCHQLNEDFTQCVLFDGHDEHARLNGVEYIISEDLFETLPEAERAYWHPHNGEILSGQLVAPGIPESAETLLMKKKMNSYGKTWHLWDTGHVGQAGDPLPFGAPMLAWSFNREGEPLPGLVAQRDRRLRIDSVEHKRAVRRKLLPLAKPQSGVDALKGALARPGRRLPGVVDRAATASGTASLPAGTGREHLE